MAVAVSRAGRAAVPCRYCQGLRIFSFKADDPGRGALLASGADRRNRKGIVMGRREAEAHLEMVGETLSLASMEQQLREDGYTQEGIDATLAFIIEIRRQLADRGELPCKKVRPS
jgi:hypothetical protein